MADMCSVRRSVRRTNTPTSPAFLRGPAYKVSTSFYVKFNDAPENDPVYFDYLNFAGPFVIPS